MYIIIKHAVVTVVSSTSHDHVMDDAAFSAR
jgi:hypothetical protein